MTITHNIKIDLVRPEILPPVPVVQGDTCTREVKISLYAAGEALELPEGHDVAIRYGKPDETSGIYDTLPDNSVAWTSEGNTVSVMLCPQMLTCPGKVPTQVSIIVGDRIISTFAFLVLVEADPSKGAMKSENYNNWRKAFMPQTEGAKVGQYLQIVEVDADGRTIAVAAVDDPAADAKTYANAAALSAESAKQAADIALGLAEQANEAVQKVSDAKDIADEAQSTADQALEKVDYLSQNVQRIEDELQDHSDYISSKLNAPAKATVGQFVRVTAVDSSGKITATEAVDAPSGGSDVPEYVRAEAERLAQAVQSRQNANTISIMLASDIHARLGLTSGSYLTTQQLATTKHAAQGMQIIRERVHLDAVGLLGDLLWDNGESQEQAMEMYRIISEYFHPAFNGLPQIWSKGNHDMLSYSGASGTELTDAQIFTAIGIHNNGTFDPDNRVQGYCYWDLPDFKVRLVNLNSCETSNSYAVSVAQNEWITATLDLSEKPGWKSIIFSHVPLDYWGAESAVLKNIANFADTILCNIHGHLHNYNTGLLAGTTIPRICIPNMDFYRSNERGASDSTYGEATTYPKAANSRRDTAFCVLTFDLATNKLYADRYGAGYDRVVDLTTGECVGSNYDDEIVVPDTGGGDEGGTDEPVQIVNQIPLSVGLDGNPYNGGVGYKTGYRLNSSGIEVQATGMCCTGFIPVTGTDVVRIKNVDLNGPSNSYLALNNGLAEGMIAGSLNPDDFPAVDANGVITINIADLNSSAKYMRLSCGVIDDTSIITVNQEIT